MALNAVSGNMYKYLGPDVPPLVATWNPIAGCTHSCVYCHTKYGFRLDMRPRFRKSYLKDDLYEHGEGTVFVGSVADWGCPEVEMGWIQDVLRHCQDFPQNTFLFQSKSPDIFLRLQHYEPGFPENTILATTIETNLTELVYRVLTRCKATQTPVERAYTMRCLDGNYTKMVTVEPVLVCDPVVLSNYIAYAQVDVVTIGANSYHKACPLSEPSADEIEELVRRLSRNGNIKAVVVKANLKRLLGGKVLDYPRVYMPKKELL